MLTNLVWPRGLSQTPHPDHAGQSHAINCGVNGEQTEQLWLPCCSADQTPGVQAPAAIAQPSNTNVRLLWHAVGTQVLPCMR